MFAPHQYARSADATASAVGERVVLYHRLSRTAIVLNPTGGWMWQRLSQPRTAEELTAALRQRFPALTVEDAERDVTSFLADLSKHAMVSVG
jgi:hypothetical protein